MSVAKPNDPRENAALAAKLSALRDRAAQQPTSYIQLFREAMDVADDLFHRAMCAEAEIYRLRQRDAAGNS